MRHGERVDFTFGPWVPYCFDDAGNYVRKDLNMPKTVPTRKGSPKSFATDCPLTNVGILQATLLGETLKESRTKIHSVYCSPSLRCIQTCDAVLRGLGIANEMQINIEPGLFEWLVWYPESIPDWMTSEELIKAGFNICRDYKPFVNVSELTDCRESCEEFYNRSTLVTRGALKQSTSGNIFLVGHAATLEVCTRDILGEKPRPPQELTKLIQKVPYCSLLAVSNTRLDKWEIVEPPCQPMTHSNNQRFDWKVFLR